LESVLIRITSPQRYMLHMTPSGEQLTLKGEFNHYQENAFSFNRAVAVSYGINLEDRGKVEITLNNIEGGSLECYQMIFVLKGKLSILGRGINGSINEIGSQQHNLCRISSNASRLVINSPGDEVVCINLSNVFFNRYLTEKHPVKKHFSNQEADGAIMLSTDSMYITSEMNAILQRIGNLSSDGFCDQLLLESKVIELMALQISQYEQLESRETVTLLKKEELERMQQARDILIDHTGEQLSLRALAHLVGTNEYNLKRDFKTVFGTSVYRYLSQYKMEQAKDLMMKTDITIAEISQRIGYKHATHFTSAFKKYFGYLPNKIKSAKLSLLLLIEDFSMLLENLELFIL
jgi:AraC-like DNA-binding protein